MSILFNCLSHEFKRPFGCVRQHELCQLTVKVPQSFSILRLEVVLSSESGFGMRVAFTQEAMDGDYLVYKTEFSIPRCGLYFYHFHCDTDGSSFDIYRQGETGTEIDRGDPWQITCYPVDFVPPEEYAGAIMYQIFPDRFYREGECDLSEKLTPYWIHDTWGETPHFRPNEQGEVLNNDFFGGNFNGIRKKLPHLKALNVDVIYLCPVCMAFSNHRYDTADYRRPDPMLGTPEEFSALCDEAHSLGIKVILDGVFSHTGSNSVYFDKNRVFGNGAVSNPQSPYRSWYDFQDYPDRYTSWWGIDTLPCVSELDYSYQEFIINGPDSVISYWLNLGADGFRLDVADELPDEFIAAFRRRLKELNPDALLLGEVWEDASNKISYSVRRRYFSGGELDSVMNYPFRNAILGFMANPDSNQFRATVMSIVEHYPSQVLHCVMNSLSTHDTPRILTLLGDNFSGSKEEKAERYLGDDARIWAVRREMAAAILQFGLPGMPCIFYGDEAGLEGFEDPLNRRCYPWGKENGDLVEFYKALTAVKASTPALKRGKIWFQPSHQQLIHFTRELGCERVHVIVNGSPAPVTLPLHGKSLLARHGRLDGDQLHLYQWGAAIILEEV